MKHISLFILFIPLFLSAQESITYTSPLSEYISDTHKFEEIDRAITLRDSTITIYSKGKEVTDIQTWIIAERLKEGSNMAFKCLSSDKKFPTIITVFDYLGKVERIEVKQPPFNNNQLIRFHIN